MSNEVTGAHPIYARGDQAAIDEYNRMVESARHWQSLHARADSEAERYQFTLEAIAQHPSGTSRAGESMRRWAQRTLAGQPPWDIVEDDEEPEA